MSETKEEMEATAREEIYRVGKTISDEEWEKMHKELRKLSHGAKEAIEAMIEVLDSTALMTSNDTVGYVLESISSGLRERINGDEDEPTGQVTLAMDAPAGRKEDERHTTED